MPGQTAVEVTALEAPDAIDGLEGLEALDGLDGLEGLDAPMPEPKAEAADAVNLGVGEVDAEIVEELKRLEERIPSPSPSASSPTTPATPATVTPPPADPTDLGPLFRDSRYFVIKSHNAENVSLSKARGVWATLPQNETTLNRAFRESRNVILLFSVKESGRFAGWARLQAPSRRGGPAVAWVLPPGLSARALSGLFRVAWVCRKELPFSATLHLYNPWNEGKPVKVGRDGQEVEPRVAEELCRLFPPDESIQVGPIIREAEAAGKRLAKLPPRNFRAPIAPRRPPPPRRPRRRPLSPYPTYPPRRRDRDSVAEYLRALRLPPLPYAPPPPPPPPAPYAPCEPPPPPRYYDGPPPPDFPPYDKRAYDRSVEEFLWRTAERSRRRSPPRRPRRVHRRPHRPHRPHSHHPHRDRR